MPTIQTCNEQRVCDGDTNLACENVQGTYYCCDPLGASRATTISGLSSTVPALTSAPTSLPPNQSSNSANGVYASSSTTLSSSLSTASLATSLAPGLGSNTSTIPTAVNPKALVSECSDQRPDVCALITDMCTIPKHRPFVVEICPRTCNLCPQPTECTDKYLACRVWARNNFCNLVIYREETKRRLCGATCCMCNRNSQIANPLCPMSNSTSPTTFSGSPPTGSTPSPLSLAQALVFLQDPLQLSLETTQSPPSVKTQTTNSSSSSTTTPMSTSGSSLTTQASTVASSTRRNGQVRPRAGVGQNGSNRANQGDSPMGQGGFDQGAQSISVSTRRPRAGQ
uniref:ShKT domain-containing protein n=1 Tax=Ditylenchus dipsaci TaxID=166011 RepID=A0A915CLS2_9BILA